jgi:hypothetical protein
MFGEWTRRARTSINQSASLKPMTGLTMQHGWYLCNPNHSPNTCAKALLPLRGRSITQVSEVMTSFADPVADCAPIVPVAPWRTSRGNYILGSRSMSVPRFGLLKAKPTDDVGRIHEVSVYIVDILRQFRRTICPLCPRGGGGGAQEEIDQNWPRQTSDHPNPEILTVNPQRILYGLNIVLG